MRRLFDVGPEARLGPDSAHDGTFPARPMCIAPLTVAQAYRTSSIYEMKSRKPIAECDPADPSCCPPDTPPSAAPTDGSAAEAELAALAKALGHPARVRILKLLLKHEQCIAGEIADELPLAASTVSQHLKILKESGLVKGSIDGPRRCYCADRTLLRRLRDLILHL